MIHSMKRKSNISLKFYCNLCIAIIMIAGCACCRVYCEEDEASQCYSGQVFQNDKIGDGVFATNMTVCVIEPEEYCDIQLFDVLLNPGIYEISCKQDVTLLSVERNRFCYRYGDNTIYEATDNLNAGSHSWTITIMEKGRYIFNVWVVSPSQNVRLSGFQIVRKRDVPLQIWRPENDYLMENVKYNSCNTFLFFSDIHGSVSNFKRIVAFGEKNGVNAIINAGDTVMRFLNDPKENFSWYQKEIESSKVDILSAAGNHDVWDGEYWHRAASNDIFDQIVLPIAENYSGIVLPDNAEELGLCYYFKDYGKIRVIVINSMMGDDSISFWNEVQSSWLEGVLDDAVHNEKHVVIVNHAPFPKEIAIRSERSGWNSYIDYRSWENSDEIVMDISSIGVIQEFIDNGGILICILAGHEHVDSVLTAKGYKGQFMVDIASANHLNHPDGMTTYDQSSQIYDCFDYIGIDSDNGLLKIIRIGWSMDLSMKTREMLSYNYLERKIVVQ